MVAKRAFGIDISAWQETFEPPDSHDLDFVIMKASQADYIDPTFERFYQSAPIV